VLTLTPWCECQVAIVPLAEALCDLLQPGADAAQTKRARMRIMKLRGKSCWADVGGSEEQRGFLLELAAGPVRAGKPTTPLGQAMMEL